MAPGRRPRAPRRVGPRRPQLRRLDHLVPDRRRPLHRVHVRRRAGAGVRRRRDRLLRRALHDRRLPDRLPRADPALVGLARARLRHAGRLRPRPARLVDAGAARRDHRHRRDHALHRAAARRHRGRAQGDGRHRPPADHRRVRDPRGLHLQLRPARARADRVRQGHADLPRHHRRGHRHPLQARWLGRDLRRGRGEVRRIAQPRRRRRSSPGPAQLQYATLAFGSALALFLYPHSITGVLASRDRNVIKRNMAALPAYSFILGLLALLGYMAIAAGDHADHGRRRQGRQQHDRAAAVRRHVPELVRRRRLRRHRHRRPGARRDHVDRRGEPVDPQHLQGVHQQGRDPEAGGAQQQARVAGRQGRRAGGDPRASTRSSPSTCSSSAASSSCRRCPPWRSACTPAGSTAGG